MTYEVEQKFRVSDLESIEAELRQLGARMYPPVEQIDAYFAHPVRDFEKTDEAFRIRCTGQSNYITYKGPRVDRTTKTRREIELPLPDGEQMAGQFGELLEQLGFSLVTTVSKTRRPAQLVWHDSSVHIALDEVDRAGRFVELELLADEDSVPSAKRCLTSLATRLGLTDNERRSYLELILEAS